MIVHGIRLHSIVLLKNDNLENTKWLKVNGCPWDSEVFSYTAKNGNLEIMKLLKENGCPWNNRTFDYAAKNGNLENMKWLRTNGCLWAWIHLIMRLHSMGSHLLTTISYFLNYHF